MQAGELGSSQSGAAAVASPAAERRPAGQEGASSRRRVSAGVFVVDNGAASFIPFSNYLVENQAAEMIAGADKQLTVHTVVTGGQALYDTLAGFDALATQLPSSTRIVVWLNEYFGAIAADGKEFEQMRAYQEHRGRVRGVVRIARQTSDTFGKDVELMLDRRLTFDEIAQSPAFGLMAKQRLAMVRRGIFQQLDLVL